MEEDQIVVDVKLSLLSESMLHTLDRLWGAPNEVENITIFRVPYKFHQNKENLFDPSAVSIGPFHYGHRIFQAMEDQKWRFLRDFLSREDHISLDLCISEMKMLEGKARRCYSERLLDLNSDEFVKMMLLDGCFVLEYFLKSYEDRLISVGHSVFLVSDLLLIENQIPFFIVEKLFELVTNRGERMDFINYIVEIFARAGPVYDSIVPNPNPPNNINHLVHLCYHSSIPINPGEPIVFNSESFFPSMLSRIKHLLLNFSLWVLTRIFPKSNSPSLSFPNSFGKSFMIPCATELQYAGIKLRPKSNPSHMLNISFCNGVLEIPSLIITDESKTILANLIAFEQYKFGEMRANLSSFALFLDSLVKTLEDVMILQQCRIVNNYLDTEEELSNFFNQICKGMVVESNHFLDELFMEVNKYCESSWGGRRARWNRHKTKFIHDYFSSPWTVISLVVAVVIVILTCVQSFFAVYAYYVPPS